MEKSKDQNVCIRLCRDEQQIDRCKQHIKELENPIAEFAHILHLAGNEVRMKILVLLQQETKLCVCDLSDVLDMKTPAISQHLRKMKDAKLVINERQGTTIFYRINPEFQTKLDIVFRGCLTRTGWPANNILI